jgi:RHS repeat-associated protein
VTTDDGSRVWVDNQLVIDAWWDQAPTSYSADVDLAGGDHTVRYEFYEHTGGATAQLSWAFAPAPDPGPAAIASPGGSSGGVPVVPAGVTAAVGPLAFGGLLLSGLVVWRLRDRRRRLPATAALLPALLLIPANALAQSSSEVIEYYHLDALGSVRVVTDQTGAVLRRHDFKPFGEEINVSFPNPDRKLFTGQERDSETGLDYFGARYYRAGIGKFTTVGPGHVNSSAEDSQSWNGYALWTATGAMREPTNNSASIRLRSIST